MGPARFASSIRMTANCVTFMLQAGVSPRGGAPLPHAREEISA
jgi:hypothetical protein